MRRKSVKVYLEEGIGEPEKIVFERNMKPMEQNFIRRQFKRILRTAKLREVRLHDARHTYASLLLSDGQSPVYVKEQMEHHSINVTVDLYGHLIPSSNREAVNRLDSASMRSHATKNAPSAKEKVPNP